MGRPEVEAYLTHLAVDRNVDPSTQNVAMQAILFLYKQVLGVEVTGINALRAKRDKRLPVVLSKAEALAVLEQIGDPLFRLQAKLLYGTGMRLLECLRLRVKDLDFERYQIVVRDTKGNEDRVTMLPWQLMPILQDHLGYVKQLTRPFYSGRLTGRGGRRTSGFMIIFRGSTQAGRQICDILLTRLLHEKGSSRPQGNPSPPRRKGRSILGRFAVKMTS